jgi:excinuclease UvrABC ATPase subunit
MMTGKTMCVFFVTQKTVDSSLHSSNATESRRRVVVTMRTLWSILVPYVPKPEVVEIEHLIGKKLIDHNEVSHPPTSFPLNSWNDLFHI